MPPCPGRSQPLHPAVTPQNDEVVVVCKSCSVPVHVSGQYRRNTVLQILDKLHGLSDLLNVNRLDRVGTLPPMLAS